LHGPHLKGQAATRAAPIEVISRFSPQDWELLTVSVRTDSCKFVNSAWRREIGGRTWLIVIGLHDTLQTVYPVSGDKDGPDIVRSGPLYDRVADVNTKLMAIAGLEGCESG
jgi:hypothetical protein